MSGFETVFGYIFSFLILIAVFTGLVVIFQEQVNQQEELIESNNENSFINSLRTSFEVLSPIDSSGRLYLRLNNTGSDKLFFRDADSDCFSFFINTNFIDNDNYKFAGIGSLDADYKFIESGDRGVVIIDSNIDSTKENDIRVISCSGIEKDLNIKANKTNWWNDNWKSRNQITINNPSNNQLSEYQILIEFNSSNFDFNKGRYEDLRFLLPIENSYLLDLTFDTYNQQIEDYSNYSNQVILGETTSQESSDPSQLIENSLLFSSINLDGLDDYVYVDNQDSLLNEETFSFSMWFKWELEGENEQYLFNDVNSSTSLKLINDGTINDSKLVFSLDIEGQEYEIVSDNNITNNQEWYNVIGVYDGVELNLYVDSVNQGSVNVEGNMDFDVSDMFLGSFNSSINFFNGSLDEIKFLDMAITDNEINNLYSDELFFRELPFYVTKWDTSNKLGQVYVKTPNIMPQSNQSIYVYYESSEELNSTSSIEQTFSYNYPRTVGFIVSDRISSQTGVNIMSLYDDNIVMIGDNSYNLDKFETVSVPDSQITNNMSVKMKYLAQIEGGSGADKINPISWASTNFSYSGLRNTLDYTCINSPFDNASIRILDSGIEQTSFNLGIGETFCHSNSTGTNNVLSVESDVPVIATYYGDVSDDSFNFYPLTSEDLFSVPSQNLRLSSGGQSTNVIVRDSDQSFSLASLGPYDSNNNIASGSASQGGAPAYRLEISDYGVGAIQQADSDGTESSVFVPEKEFGKIYGSGQDIEYITLVSTHPDSNCNVYTNTSSSIERVVQGNGSKSVYKYGFNLDNSLYISEPWILECQRPVWGYYERDSDSSETNMFGHVQMRQFNYPEPIVNIY